jgi:hypothetical protein
MSQRLRTCNGVARDPELDLLAVYPSRRLRPVLAILKVGWHPKRTLKQPDVIAARSLSKQVSALCESPHALGVRPHSPKQLAACLRT